MGLRVLMLLDNPFTNDPRVEREAETLARAGHQVTILAAAGDGLPARERRCGAEVERLIGARMFDLDDFAYRRRLAQAVAARPFDVLHCHDHWMLHLGAAVKRRRPGTVLLYDSHELFRHWPLNVPASAGPWLRAKSRLARRVSVFLENRDARHVDWLVTVNESLARILARQFALRRPPVVLRNVPRAAPLPARSTLLRDRLRLAEGTRVVVCTTANVYARTLNLEQVVDELAGVEHVALVVVGGTGPRSDVAAYARARGAANAHFLERVAPEELPPLIASADVGLVPTWNRRDLSYWYALDNKLFGYVSAGVPVLATAQPEYRAIVEGHDLGVCVDADRPGAFQDGLARLFSRYEHHRQMVLSARTQLVWEREEGALVALYGRIAADQAA